MSPLEIEIALHYHCRLGDFWQPDSMPPIGRETLDWFRRQELLAPAIDPPYYGRQNWAPTEKLHAYVTALCRVPLPIAVWQTAWPTNDTMPAGENR